MSYTTLALVGLGVAVITDLALLRTGLLLRKAFWTAYAILLCFQLIVNGLLTGLPVVRYDPGTILGIRFVYAPVEDLMFGFALMLITLSTWVFLGRLDIRRGNGAERARHVPGPGSRPRRGADE